MHYMYSVYRRYFVVDTISKDAMEVVLVEKCQPINSILCTVHAQTK